MRRPAVLSVTMLLTLAACGESTSPTAVAAPLAARAASTNAGDDAVRASSVVQFGRPFYNACVGESVWGEGELHLVRSVVRDADGGEREVFHANPRGVTGIGELSGDRYHMVGTENRVRDESPDGDGHDTVVQVMRLVSASSGQDLSLRMVLHARTVDGERTWEVEHASSDCRS